MLNISFLLNYKILNKLFFTIILPTVINFNQKYSYLFIIWSFIKYYESIIYTSHLLIKSNIIGTDY